MLNEGRDFAVVIEYGVDLGAVFVIILLMMESIRAEIWNYWLETLRQEQN
ncbi:hypothetical protein [Niallia circulans]|jgi:hypothetical protein|nr:hypothetical protein [Niallia circulans]MED3840932.1 hypothetical protein [Niallia circulans]MED4246080.1 hypothetical protein [Niallia circulans]MED4247715.1 hypothetical protein [Niallia circulans]QKH63428.1 hypothetical protein FOC77_23735 [Niallia circulans]